MLNSPSCWLIILIIILVIYWSYGRMIEGADIGGALTQLYSNRGPEDYYLTGDWWKPYYGGYYPYYYPYYYYSPYYYPY